MPFKHALLIAALIPLAGFTDCEYFSTVTVPSPAQDRSVPVVGARMWIDGQERTDLGGTNRISLTGDVVVAPFVYDSGGAGFLSLVESVVVRCHDFNAEPELGQLTRLEFIAQTTSQSGSPGQRRSDGMYLLSRVSDLTSFTSLCHAGFTPISVVLGWSVVGRDLAGKRSSATGAITWQAGVAAATALTAEEKLELEVELLADPSLRASSTTVEAVGDSGPLDTAAE